MVTLHHLLSNAVVHFLSVILRKPQNKWSLCKNQKATCLLGIVQQARLIRLYTNCLFDFSAKIRERRCHSVSATECTCIGQSRQKPNDNASVTTNVARCFVVSLNIKRGFFVYKQLQTPLANNTICSLSSNQNALLLSWPFSYPNKCCLTGTLHNPVKPKSSTNRHRGCLCHFATKYDHRQSICVLEALNFCCLLLRK